MDKFSAKVQEIRAEQFFAEKRASTKVSAVALANLARAGNADDPGLLKLAAVYCPEAPVAFYEKLGGKLKSLDETESELAHEELAAAKKSGEPKRLSRARGDVEVFGVKTAEPPLPKGVSSKKWDEILGGKPA